VPFVANRLVEVELVLVVFVKMPVDGVVAPIVVPLIVPPEMVTLEEVKVGAVRDAIVPFKALIVVPDAVLKPNQFVEVPFPKERSWRLVVPVTVRSVTYCSRVVPFTTKRLVEVVLVPAAFVQMRFVKEEGLVEETVMFPTTRFVSVAFTAVRSVEETEEDSMVVAEMLVVETFVRFVCPFTVRSVEETEVKVAVPPFRVVLFNVAMVEDVETRSVIVAFRAVRRPVSVRFVPVAFTKRMSSREERPETERVPVAVRSRVWMPPKA